MDVPDDYGQMLENYGNPELNNSGGLFHPMLDWGLPISLIFWLGYGVLAGRLYNNYLQGYAERRPVLSFDFSHLARCSSTVNHL